jgi:HPt (histidine-containing phosphotransfer) domain-containing protein
MTAHAMSGDRDRALEAGMDDYVVKPIRLADLAGAIQRNSLPVIDVAALLDGVGGDRKLLRRLVRLFLADAPKLMTRVERALARADAVKLQETAHALKGSVGNFDSGRAFQAVRHLEMLGREQKLVEAEAALPAAKSELTRLRRALEAAFL